MRTQSQRELKETRQRAETLIRSMEKAQRRIEPVLKPLRDRVLFLKHNLNAQAVGALDAAISEADQSVASMETPNEPGRPDKKH